MNSYITLDGKRYTAPHLGFGPVRSKPSTERITLAGSSDVTYGPGAIVEWSGFLLARVTPATGDYGDIDDLRATLEKRMALAFIDYYGVATTVYATGEHAEESRSPMWDAASNEFRMAVKLLVDQAGGVIVVCDTLELASAPPDLSTVGGAVSVSMGTLTLSGDAEYTFVSRPVVMQTLTLASDIFMDGVPQVVLMDTLVLAGAAETSTVT